MPKYIVYLLAVIFEIIGALVSLGIMIAKEVDGLMLFAVIFIWLGIIVFTATFSTPQE